MITLKLSHLRLLGAIALFVCSVFGGGRAFAAERVVVASHLDAAVATDADLGAVPGSQMMSLTVQLRPSADRVAALDALIVGQITAGGPSYRQWVTPQDFAAKFGASDEQIAAVSAWLESAGLTVSGVSAGKIRLKVTGSSARVAAAFGVQMRIYRGAAGGYFANSGSASVPESVGELVAGVSGLDDRPVLAPMTVSGIANGVDPLSSIEGIVDANTAPFLTVNSAACSADFVDTDFAVYRAVLKQAEAQGITVLATSACATGGSFPASLAEVTAVVAVEKATAGPSTSLRSAQDDGPFAGIEARPGWQFADGLPADGWRESPDVTADVTALAQTLSGISQKAGTRLGNVAPVLYELAKDPGLYTQPDNAPAGTWERATGLGVVDLKRLAEDFPRGLIGTSSLLVPSDYAPYHGKSLTLTATVTSTGGSGIPTGTVTFTSTQKGTLGTGVLNSAGVATFTTNQLPGGTYTTTSVYSGDANYSGSTSGIATITIVGEVSLITATAAPGAAVGGVAEISVSVTSASGVGTPTGTAIVAPQGTTATATATAPLSGTNGTATGTVSLPVYQAGQFTLLVSCTDTDPSFTCNSPVAIQLTVGKGGTTTTITSSPPSPSVGQTYTLTATVAGSNAVSPASGPTSVGVAGVQSGSLANNLRRTTRMQAARPAATTVSNDPTGNVQFMDGTNYLATGALTAGVATYTGTATTAAHSFNAMYSGDQNYGTSSSTSTPATSGGTTATSTSLTASTYAINVGQTITFYSTVYSVGVPSTQTGTVTYSAAAQGVLGSGTVAGGLATLTLNNLAAGTYTMTATYSGDAVFAASTSTTLVVVTVTGGVVTLSGSVSPASVPYGSDPVLSVTASFPAGALSGPVGTLVASIAGVTGATYTASLSNSTGGSSIAVFTFPAPPPGIYQITVSCPASDSFTCTAPIKIPMTVVRGGTEVSLTLSPPGPLAGQPTVLTATIGNTGDDPRAYTFTGTVQFFANNALLATAKVNGVTASASVALPAGASESITAVYSGDTDWATSISLPVVITVAALPSAITLTSNVTNALAGVNVVLTATVTNIAGGPLATTAPSGLVSFYDTFNGVVSRLGTATLVSQGANTSIATFNATGLAAGAHVLYAAYAGDLIYSASVSADITLGFTNFNVTFVPTTLTVTRGQTGQATLVVNFEGGFGGSVSFGCTPPPNVEVTCSFNPAVLLGGGTTTLVVGTVAPSDVKATGQTDSRPYGGLSRRLAGGAVLALLLMWVRPRRLSRGTIGLLLVLLAVMASGVTGCTGTNNAATGGGTTIPPVITPTDPGSSLGTQILTITTAGSDGTNTVRHDFQYQVTVQ